VILTEAIVEHIRPSAYPGLLIMSGEGEAVYPHVMVSIFPEDAPQEAQGGSYIAELPLQISAISLDPVEAEEIGMECLYAMVDYSDGGPPPIVWDQGEPGREMSRHPGPTRRRKQVGAGPDGRDVFFFEFDSVILIQRDRRRPIVTPPPPPPVP
jgi:hypothetical protein